MLKSVKMYLKIVLVWMWEDLAHEEDGVMKKRKVKNASDGENKVWFANRIEKCYHFIIYYLLFVFSQLKTIFKN